MHRRLGFTLKVWMVGERSLTGEAIAEAVVDVKEVRMPE